VGFDRRRSDDKCSTSTIALSLIIQEASSKIGRKCDCNRKLILSRRGSSACRIVDELIQGIKSTFSYLIKVMQLIEDLAILGNTDPMPF